MPIIYRTKSYAAVLTSCRGSAFCNIVPQVVVAMLFTFVAIALRYGAGAEIPRIGQLQLLPFVTGTLLCYRASISYVKKTLSC